MERRNQVSNAAGNVEGRVRENTAPEVNARLDREFEDRVRLYATKSREEISRRIADLESEWSIERVLETEAASMGLFGLTLGATINRKLLVLPALVAGMLCLHAVQGWCPPVPVFRRLGVRTRQEIDREKYALKALRGDFKNVATHTGAGDDARAREAIRARARESVRQRTRAGYKDLVV